MADAKPDLRSRLYKVGIVILVVGICGAAVLFVTIDDRAPEAEQVQTVIIDGKTYAVPLQQSKTYRRELERFGGKAAVVFDDFNRWFAGLWRGKSLAITVLWISVIAAGVAFVLGNYLSPRPASQADLQDRQDRSAE